MTFKDSGHQLPCALVDAFICSLLRHVLRTQGLHRRVASAGEAGLKPVRQR
ncbi:MAG TPA: hypothetical protein VLK61_06860 [Aquabacterium sp.]|nr:hypothetical protein [Aquabacterium sp.]